MLGEEVDAMERAHHPDDFEDLLEQPKSKKIKLPASRTASPQKAAEPRLPFPSAPTEPGHLTAATEPKKASSRTLLDSNSVSTAPPALATTQTAAYTQPQPPVDLPPTVQNNMPLKMKRSRSLLTTLAKDPNAYLVRH
jgi:hypothetical protein